MSVPEHPVYEILNNNLGPKETVAEYIFPIDNDPLKIELFRIAKKLAERRKRQSQSQR